MRAYPVNLSRELDEPTVTYVLDMGIPFEDLRRVAAQLSGMLLLAAAGSKYATPQHPVFGMAHASVERAMESIQSVTVTARAEHHHFHMLKSLRLIRSALVSCTSNGALAADLDLILSVLKDAWDHLRLAAAALPGFEVIAFDRACCAEHIRMA